MPKSFFSGDDAQALQSKGTATSTLGAPSAIFRQFLTFKLTERHLVSARHTQNTNACLSCDLVKGTKQSLGGTIVETRLFHAHQDFAYPIPGSVILAAKRHFYGMDELSNQETDEFIPLVKRIRSAQRHALGIEHVYYFYNEDTSHHFIYGWFHGTTGCTSSESRYKQ